MGTSVSINQGARHAHSRIKILPKDVGRRPHVLEQTVVIKLYGRVSTKKRYVQPTEAGKCSSPAGGDDRKKCRV
jgi:hypothetical protein